MYQIKFKGRDTEPLYVDDKMGASLLEKWQADKLPQRMVHQGTAFLGGDIKSITKVIRTEAEKAPTHKSADQEYLAFRRNMLSLSVEKRAEILRIPKLIYQAHTGREMPEETKQLVKARQLTYFQEHPGCIYANPATYRDLIPQRQTPPKKDKMTPAHELVPGSILHFIEEAIRTDLKFARQERNKLQVRDRR